MTSCWSTKNKKPATSGQPAKFGGGAEYQPLKFGGKLKRRKKKGRGKRKGKMIS
jgi:hypothetical protein